MNEKELILEKRFILKYETQIPLHSRDISPTYNKIKLGKQINETLIQSVEKEKNRN